MTDRSSISLFAAFCLFFLLSLFSGGEAQGHITQFSQSQLGFQNGQVHWDLQFHLGDFEKKFYRTSDEQALEYLIHQLGVSAGDTPCVLKNKQLQKNPQQEWISLNLTFDCPPTDDLLKIRYGVFLGDLSHRHFLKFSDDQGITELTFSPAQSLQEIQPKRSASAFSTFFVLGVEHILLGYDHIVFLLALLFGARRFKTLLYLITAFTLAHSLTLALASLDFLQVSPRWVEPMIALSILVVALWDLIEKKPDGIWVLVTITFSFGLVHGLGFSFLLKNALQNIASPIRPLLWFNLGVETGQLLLVSLIFPPLHWCERCFPRFWSPFRKISLGLIALLALYWLVIRLFFFA